MIPKRVWLALSAFGIVVGLVIAFVPVRVQFASDPLLRLRDLDPELSPPAATADCGPPREARRTTARGTSLYELARASACRDAGRRRLAVATAAGAAIVILGLIGAANVGRPRPAAPRKALTPVGDPPPP